MPLQNGFQSRFVDVCLLEHLLYARLVLLPAHACSYRHDLTSANVRLSDGSLAVMTNDCQIHS